MPAGTLADLTTGAMMADAKKGRKWVKDDKLEAEEKPAFAPPDRAARRKAMYPSMKGNADG